jgi:type II secretory pathway pseudopilin PulG
VTSRRHSRGVCVKRLRSGFGAWYKHRYNAAFTLIELIIVIAIIIILAGLILSTVGYVQKKAARARAENEIAAMSAACESYKADNGIYPRDNATNGYTDALTVQGNGDSTTYWQASQYLYGELSGDRNFNNVIDASEQANRTYFTFKPQMLGGTTDANGNLISVSYIRDPFGNSYGYSTKMAATGSGGYNPTFDLWSTASANPQNQWIKNW